jgi:predicted transcriptional regulator
MPKPATIEHCMHKNPVTIGPDANIAEAVELMVEYKLTGLTVTDSEGLVVGVLSELDCLASILDSIYNEGNAERALVSDVMMTDVNSCTSADGIVEVAQHMRFTGQRRRPVIDQGQLVGQVSSGNILWALLEYSRRKTHGEA